MKITVMSGFVLLAGLAIWGGCSSAPKTDPNIPAWLNEVPPEGELWGIGLALYDDAALAMQTAEDRARLSLSRQVETGVKAMVESYQGASGAGTATTSVSDLEQVSRQLTSVTIRGAEPNRRERTPDGTWWIRVRYSKSALKEEASNALDGLDAGAGETSARKSEALRRMEESFSRQRPAENVVRDENPQANASGAGASSGNAGAGVAGANSAGGSANAGNAPATDIVWFDWISNNFGIIITKYKGVSANVVIPDQIGGVPVTAIRGAFSGCTWVTGVTIPNSVTSIGGSAFYGCARLTSVTIPNSVTSIRDFAFSGCTGLTSVTIPNSVDSIESKAFNGCTGLTSVTIPNSVTSIGQGAFAGCTGLTSITIPNSVTSIGERAFYDCTRLTSVTIPNSVTTIKYNAFSGCTGLTSVTIPNSVTSIGQGAFAGCTGLTSITIPNSVTSIGERAFYDCTRLTSVTIPNSVTSIGQGAFRGCTRLTSVTVDNQNPQYTSNAGVLFDKQIKTLIVYPAGKSDSSYTIPNSVTAIGNEAFSGCTGLTSVTIPNSVTAIGNEAFSGCTGLTSVTIPNSVTTIGDAAFSGCTGLTSVTIPNSVTSIRPYTFSGCNGLKEVTLSRRTKVVGLSFPLGAQIRYSD